MPGGEDIGGCQVALGKLCLLGACDFENLLRVVVEVAPCLVAQVGRRFAVADYLDGIIHADGAVVGGDDDGMAALGEHLEDGIEVGMFEPGARQGAECRFVLGQFADDFRFGAGV